ncbi:MAG: NADH-quinone oxidoreductase subunit NuoH, partial [Actinomycetota bacterium]
MLAIDPLLVGDLDLGDVAVVLLKVVVVFVIGLVATMLMVWFERKAIAGMQNRIGPNKAGPFGILQTLADGIKLFFKEDLIPERSDRFVFKLAPYLSFVPAFLVWTVIPLGGDYTGGRDGLVTWFGRETRVQLADPQVGVLLLLALSSIAVYGIMLAGWSSGSKYPLLGSVRASAQMVSYEAALGMSMAAVLLLAGTLSTSGIVAAQQGTTNWHLISTGILPFMIFMIAATAELNRPPFDLVEAEQELVGGFNTEYSSIRFALFFLAEFMNTITMSAIIVTLFLGGPAGPTFFGPDWIWGPVWFLGKLLIFLFTFVWLRATLPRFRYDQLMDLGWRVLVPLA